MDRLILFASILLFATASCTKVDTSRKGKEYPNGLAGKWNYTEDYYSIGGPLLYRPAHPPGQWVDFRENGTLTSTMELFKGVDTYEVQDSIRIRFFTPAHANGYFSYFYSIDTITHTLSLSSLDYICIEECGIRLERQ